MNYIDRTINSTLPSVNTAAETPDLIIDTFEDQSIDKNGTSSPQTNFVTAQAIFNDTGAGQQINVSNISQITKLKLFALRRVNSTADLVPPFLNVSLYE